MSHDSRQTVGSLPDGVSTPQSPLPALATRGAWVLVGLTVVLVAVRLRGGVDWTLSGVVAVDGLTVTMWAVVAFFSALVHSYSRRYMAGDRHITAFFARLVAFTLAVMVLVAADHVVLFTVAWLAMGLVMAGLVGHVRGWPQARAAASLARRYFLASTLLLAGALAAFWQATGATTISGIVGAVDGTPASALLFVGIGLLVLAALVQSALVPFHTWLLSSMTAPTPASALMHAGFVNAGGILLVRFAPVVSLDGTVMLAIVLAGASSALFGKLAKSVQPDVKGTLGCSTVGQMGFMVMQAGLGFFGAALTHLVLHGFYKAYQFLSAGEEVAQTRPSAGETGGGLPGVGGLLVVGVTALAGGAVFTALTGKGTGLDSGLVLTLLVVVMTMHATAVAVRQSALPPFFRYGAVPAVFLPAIALYAGAYKLVTVLLADLPLVTAPVVLGPGHALVAAGFVLAYVAIETGLHTRSRRLYVLLVNATQQPTRTVTTALEEYDVY